MRVFFDILLLGLASGALGGSCKARPQPPKEYQGDSADWTTPVQWPSIPTTFSTVASPSKPAPSHDNSWGHQEKPGVGSSVGGYLFSDLWGYTQSSAGVSIGSYSASQIWGHSGSPSVSSQVHGHFSSESHKWSRSGLPLVTSSVHVYSPGTTSSTTSASIPSITIGITSSSPSVEPSSSSVASSTSSASSSSSSTASLSSSSSTASSFSSVVSSSSTTSSFSSIVSSSSTTPSSSSAAPAPPTITNGDFETGDLTGWSLSIDKNPPGTVTANVVACSTDCISGNYYYEITADNGIDEAGFSTVLSQYLTNLVAGSTYKMTAYTKGTGNVGMFYDQQILFNDGGSSDWQARDSTFTAITNGRLGLSVGGNGGNDVKYDAITITLVT